MYPILTSANDIKKKFCSWRERGNALPEPPSYPPPPFSNAGFTLSPSAFGEIFMREFHEMKLRVRLSTLFDSQARHETLWLGHHGPLKKRELTRRDTSTRGYTRASEARRVFPSTFLLSRCLEFSHWECTAGIKQLQFYINLPSKFDTGCPSGGILLHPPYHNGDLRLSMIIILCRRVKRFSDSRGLFWIHLSTNVFS